MQGSCPTKIIERINGCASAALKAMASLIIENNIFDVNGELCGKIYGEEVLLFADRNKECQSASARIDLSIVNNINLDDGKLCNIIISHDRFAFNKGGSLYFKIYSRFLVRQSIYDPVWENNSGRYAEINGANDIRDLLLKFEISISDMRIISDIYLYIAQKF